MNNHNNRLSKNLSSRNMNGKIHNHNSEKGAAMVIALIIIVAFIVIISASMRTVTAISREGERNKQKREETARAEYYISMAEATLKYDIRDKYNDYQIVGKQKELQLGGSGKLPMFDPLVATQSRPLLDLESNHTGEDVNTATSLYGNSNRWASLAVTVSSQYIAAKSAEKNIAAPDGVRIVSFAEAYRRQIVGSDEPVYAFKYVVKATAGKLTEIIKEDTVQLGAALVEDQLQLRNCADLDLTGTANPSNIAWGSSTNLEITYKNSERVVLYKESGEIVADQIVTYEDTPRKISYTTAPLTSPTTFVAEAVLGTCQIQVPIPVGVQFSQTINYTVNGAQTVNIIEGENVQYAWQATNAANGYTTSYITYSNQSGNFYDNVYSNSVNVPGPVQSISSVLHVRDSRYNGGSEQTAAVNINVCRLPRLTSFTATPNSVSAGSGTVRLAWTTQFAAGVRIAGVGDFGPNGYIDIPAPAATRDYTIQALSDCGAPPASGQVRVIVSSCQAPVINNFDGNPNTVKKGEYQNIVFTWNVSGQIDSQSIDQGIGAVSGNSHAIVQPQNTTWYTYSVTGCGQTQTARVKINVNNSPQPNASQCVTSPRNGFEPLGSNAFLTFKGTIYELFVNDNVAGNPVNLNILVTHCSNNYAQFPVVLYEYTSYYQGSINSSSNAVSIDYIELVAQYPSFVLSDSYNLSGTKVTSPPINNQFVSPVFNETGVIQSYYAYFMSIMVKYRVGNQTYFRAYQIATNAAGFPPPNRTRTGYSYGITGVNPTRYGLTEDWAY